MSRQILTLDSSQIETFLDCDQEWAYKYGESIVLTPLGDKPAREDMAMGSYGHSILETYYRMKALGSSATDAIEAAFMTPAETFDLSKTNSGKVREACNRYFMFYSGRDVTTLMGSPTRKVTFNDNGTYKGEDWDLNPLVEKGFSFPLLDTPDYLFTLEGRIDLLCDQNGTQAFMDHKFQSRESRLYKKSIQFRNYGMVTGVKLGIINYIRFHKDLSDKTLVREFISFGPLEHEWWKEELIQVFHTINVKMKSGDFERRWNMCRGKFGYPCQYNKLCEERNDAVRDNIKSQYYSIREKWSPW
jgi:hypothetical protein